MITKCTWLIAALAIGACGGKRPQAGEAVTLNASGSTFQKTAQEVAIEAFTATNKNIKINYGAGGSGKGRQDFADQVVDYACTDAPYKDADLATLEGGPFVYIPNVFGAITVSYQLDGLDELQLSPATLAKIFQREIKSWNDPAIAADNPGATLPAAAIVVVHRSDGSGTTENFTKYLDLAAPGVWKLESGSTVEWSADTRAGNGNGGVAQLVKTTQGAIGYVDLSDAKASGLALASIKNAAGKYVQATAAGVTAAGDGIAVADNLIFSALDPKENPTPPGLSATIIPSSSRT